MYGLNTPIKREIFLDLLTSSFQINAFYKKHSSDSKTNKLKINEWKEYHENIVIMTLGVSLYTNIT